VSPTDRPASLARRALPAFALLGVSGVLLTKLDLPASGKVGASAAGARPTTGLSPTTPSTRAVGTLPPTVGRQPVNGEPGDDDQPPGTQPVGNQPAGNRPPPATVPVRKTAAATTVPPVPTSCAGGRTIDGSVVDTRWGPVQVAATLSADGKLCDVTALQYPNDRRRSQSINDQALPILHDRAIAAQGPAFDTVSGATITSDGYATSLQAALDAR
jgi:uncharacterized protein with FMN-binding domain